MFGSGVELGGAYPNSTVLGGIGTIGEQRLNNFQMAVLSGAHQGALKDVSVLMRIGPCACIEQSSHDWKMSAFDRKGQRTSAMAIPDIYIQAFSQQATNNGVVALIGRRP